MRISDLIQSRGFLQVEIDPTEINKNVKVDVALIGDLREVLRELLPRLQADRLQ